MNTRTRSKAVGDTPEPTKSELTRHRILNAAARVLAQRGYAHTRLSDVAKEAKVHAGGIYYYFASREVLVAEVLDLATQRAVEELRLALDKLPPDSSTSDRLVAAATAQLRGIMAEDSYNLAHNRVYSQVPKALQKAHQPLLREYFSVWRKIILEGQAKGEIRSDLDPAILRLTIAGSIQWASEWASASHGSADKLARKMMDIYLSGILIDKAAQTTAKAA